MSDKDGMKDYTLSKEAIVELEALHRSLRDKRQADRVKAVIALAKGWLVIQIAEILLFDEKTSRNYFERYQQGGIRRLHRLAENSNRPRYVAPKGRPSGQKATRIAAKNKRVQQKITDLFEYRYLFVKRSLTPREQKILRRITRGMGHLRALRQIMDEIYRLFDRHCRMDTALKKLARLRRKIGRFAALADTLKKLWSPNLEKA